MESKKGATSSHTTTANAHCLMHNRREHMPVNADPSRTHNNVSWESEKLEGKKYLTSLMTEAKNLYKAKVGQKAQNNFAPFKESVVVCRENSTMDEAKQFASLIEKKIGWECLGIWFHRDEGPARAKFDPSEPFKGNFHVHVLWNTQNPNTGRIIRVNRNDLRGMQDAAAEAFHMERGNSATDTKTQHIRSQELKIKGLMKEQISLEHQNLQLELDIQHNEFNLQNLKDEYDRTDEQFYDIKSRADLLDKETNQQYEKLKNIEKSIKAQTTQLKNLECQIEEKKKQGKAIEQELQEKYDRKKEMLDAKIKELDIQKNKAETDLASLHNEIKEDTTLYSLKKECQHIKFLNELLEERINHALDGFEFQLKLIAKQKPDIAQYIERQTKELKEDLGNIKKMTHETTQKIDTAIAQQQSPVVSTPKLGGGGGDGGGTSTADICPRCGRRHKGRCDENRGMHR